MYFVCTASLLDTDKYAVSYTANPLSTYEVSCLFLPNIKKVRFVLKLDCEFTDKLAN